MEAVRVINARQVPDDRARSPAVPRCVGGNHFFSCSRDSLASNRRRRRRRRRRRCPPEESAVFGTRCGVATRLFENNIAARDEGGISGLRLVVLPPMHHTTTNVTIVRVGIVADFSVVRSGRSVSCDATRAEFKKRFDRDGGEMVSSSSSSRWWWSCSFADKSSRL